MMNPMMACAKSPTICRQVECILCSVWEQHLPSSILAPGSRQRRLQGEFLLQMSNSVLQVHARRFTWDVEQTAMNGQLYG